MISEKSRVCVLCVVERKSGYVKLELLKSKTADQVHEGLAANLGNFPGLLLKTNTYDNGSENTPHLETDTLLGTKSYFCHPYSPWEKAAVENTIELVRQYLPKRTDLSKISRYELKVIEKELNDRPRKRRGCRTPAEVLCNFVA